MENFEKAMSLSTISANSAGSALEKFDIYQESTQAKLTELTNQFQIFANNVIDGQVIKAIIGLGTTLLRLTNTDIGQAIVKTTLLISTFALLNKGLNTLKIAMAKDTAGVFLSTINGLITGTTTLKAVTASLTTTMMASPLFIPALIIGSIFTLIQALDKIPTAMEKQISKVQDLTDNLASLKSEYDGLKSKSDLTDLEKARLSLLEAELETQKELVKVESQRQYDMSKNTTSSAPTVSRGDFANFNVSTIQQTVEAYTNLKKQVASTKDEEYKRQQALASMTTEMTSYAQNLVSLKEKGVELTEEDKRLLELILRITEAQSKQSVSNNDLANSTELLNSVVNEYNNALELLQEVEEKSREGTGLTLEKKDELLQKYPQLEDAVYKMATGWGVEQEAIDALRSSLTKTAQDQASSEASRTENAKQNTLARLKLIQAEITALSSLSNSLKSYSPSLFGMAEKAIGDIPDLSKGGSPYKLSGTKQNVLQNEANILQQQVALAEKALTNAFGLVSGVHGSKTGGSKKDSSKSSTDAWKEAFDTQYKLLQHQLTMNEITESQYLDKLDMLYKKYFANKTKYTDEFMQYEEEVYTKRKKLEEELLKERLEAQKETIEKQKDALESLIDKTMELIKSEYDAEKQYYNDLIDQENKKHDDKMDNLNAEIQAKKDALEAELDGYRKIIESQLESLRLKDEERSYNKDLSERQKELAKLESELLEVSMDDTAEGRAKRLELEEKLAEKRLDIEDLQYDRGLTLQEQALQDELKRYEEATQSKLDKYDDYLETEEKRYEESLENRIKEYQDHIKDIDNYLKQEGRMRQDAMTRIESGEKNLFDKLLEYNLIYGDGTKKSFVDIWETATSALDKYADKQLSVLEILGQMDSDLTGIDLTLSGKGSTSGQLSAKGKEQLNQQKYLHDLMITAQKEGNKNLEKWIVAERLKWGMDKHGSIKQQFHDGGLVGGSTSLKSGEVVAKLLNGELVSTSSQMDTFIHDTLPKMLGISSYANEFSGIKIDMPINFAGGLDNSTLPEFKNVVETAVNKAFDKLNSAMYKKGNIRNAKSLSI